MAWHNASLVSTQRRNEISGTPFTERLIKFLVRQSIHGIVNYALQYHAMNIGQ